MVKSIPTFLTIRETAKLGIMSEHHLRLMQKSGRLLGIRTGTTFRVNVEQLIDRLNEESAAAAQQEG